MIRPDETPDADTDEERWRRIPGFPLYEISDQARVRSWKDWPGRKCPLPRMLRVSTVSGRRRVFLGTGVLRYVDDLMHCVWETSKVVRLPRPPTFRRVMLTERQHATLVRVLDLIDSPTTKRLIVPVRMAKRVRFSDPIDVRELGYDEGEST